MTSGYYTTNENEADVKVYIGKFNPINQDNNIMTLREFEFGYDYGSIIYYDKTGVNPYSGLAGSFKDANGKTVVMVVGNEIEGDIAATKEFIKNQAIFLGSSDINSIFIDDENADAIRIFDFLHLGGNNEHYNVNNNEFKKIVKNALNDEMFNVEDKTVTTNNGIDLRLRNLKPNISNDYLEYLSSTGMPVEMPVVLARGLWSNLNTWETFAGELANIGRDSWLIEITGGPNTECDTCPDYTFDDLTDSYVPTLLNGVLDFTNKDKLQYVGFSNGCRATLSSLEKGMFDPSKVETFVAVGCPGAFNGSSLFGNALNNLGDNAINKFRSQNMNHITFKNVFEAILPGVSITDEGDKISVNLFEQYFNWSSKSDDLQPGQNLPITFFSIIQGDIFGDNDGIITTFDEREIFNNINSNSKRYLRVLASHRTLADDTTTKKLIRKTLNNETLNMFERTINLINST